MNPKRKPLVDTFIKYNTMLNLSAIRDEDGIYTKHIMDSLELNKILEFKPGKKVLDIGTGGGFPLLPLAMTHADINFTGIDSRKKKVQAVNDMITELQIPNTVAVRSRIEEYKRQFDYVIARAVGYSDKLLNWCTHLVRPGWQLILYKLDSPDELKTLKNTARAKKLELIQTHKYKLFDDDIDRVIYILKRK